MYWEKGVITCAPEAVETLPPGSHVGRVYRNGGDMAPAGNENVPCRRSPPQWRPSCQLSLTNDAPPFNSLVISNTKSSALDFTIMKISQSAALAPHLLNQATQLGRRLARLRLARRIKQTDAALRAGLSRNTAYRLERGDPGLAVGQVLRYLDAIAPGSTLLDLLSESDPALAALAARERTQRVRDLSATELDELDF